MQHTQWLCQVYLRVETYIWKSLKSLRIYVLEYMHAIATSEVYNYAYVHFSILWNLYKYVLGLLHPQSGVITMTSDL